MTYIPATDAAVYKTSAITRMVAQGGGGGGGKGEEEERPPPPQPPLQPPSTIEKANGGGTTVISIGGGGGPPAQKGSGESERATLARSHSRLVDRPFQDNGPSFLPCSLSYTVRCQVIHYCARS